MKIMKKHKNAMVGLGVIILIIVAVILVKKVLFVTENTAIYGSRLNGRDNLKISNDTKNKVKESLSDSSTDVKVRIAGRIIYITIKANNDTSLDAAKELGKKALESFSDPEKKYYDIQILIENDGNQGQFPIIGYKHHTRDAIVWTKDRAEN